jgi:hypothetical protein
MGIMMGILREMYEMYEMEIVDMYYFGGSTRGRIFMLYIP